MALVGHERIAGRVLNRALVFGVNEAREKERDGKGRGMIRNKRTSERERQNRWRGTNREPACVLILEPSLPRIDVFASNTFLHRFVSLSLPLPPPFLLLSSLPLAPSSHHLFFFLALSLLRRSPLRFHPDDLFPLPSLHTPPRDNNYPFEILGAAKVTILLLATSPYAGYV